MYLKVSELESQIILSLLVFFTNIFTTRIFLWCTIQSQLYYCQFTCCLSGMSLEEWTVMPLIKSVCVDTKYTLVEKECCTRKGVPAMWREIECCLLSTSIFTWRDHFPREDNSIEFGFCSETSGWCIFTNRTTKSSVEMFWGTSEIGHFFSLSVKHPAIFAVGKMIWVWQETIMPH